MGRLLGLELHNFKSYKGTATVGFGDSSFTSIIGPNGAGKSNMMDAMSFVLGVQSYHLRSSTLKDLIYRGRIDESEPTQVCESAYVKAIYEKEFGEQMVLQRSINSAGTSEYKINDKSVTAFQYTMMLKEENILVKARNFLVFQGDIENIASQEPKQLASLIETISGSAEFASEYDRLRDEKEKAVELHAEVFSRKRNLTTESKQYKEQMRERELFEDKLREKNKYSKMAHLYKLFHNERRHFKLKSDVRLTSEKTLAARRKLAECEDDFKNKAAETTTHELEVKKQDFRIAELRQQAETTKRSTLPLQSSQKLLENKISFTTKKVRDLEADLRIQIDQEQALQAKHNDTEAQYQAFNQKIAELEQLVNIPEEGVKEYEALRNTFLADSGSQLERDLAVLQADKVTIDMSLKDLDLQKEQYDSRVKELESNMQVHLGLSLHDLNAKLQEVEQMRLEKQKEKENLQEQQERVSFKMLELNSELRDVMSRLEDLSSEQKESKKQRELRDNVSMLKALLPEGSIKGLVYELVHASQRKYDVALLTVLGADFDSVVVDTTATAHKCIETLKERRAGLASFIPLNSVVNESMNLNYLRSLHEDARPAIDIVKYEDPSIERAVQYVVGNTMIVDNLETARSLKWSSQNELHCKIVSLDGSVIHKSGLMTGGLQDKRSSATGRWSKEEMQKLLKKKDDITAELEKTATEKPSAVDINSLSEEISLLDAQKPSITNQIVVLERQLFEKNQEIQFMKESSQEIAERFERKEQDLDNLQNQIAQFEEKIKSLQQQVYSEFCDKFGLASIVDYEILHGTALRARTRQRSDFEKAISSLENQVAFQRDRIQETEQRRSKLESDIVSTKEDLERIIESLSEARENLQKIEEQVEAESQAKTALVEAMQEKMRSAAARESEMKELEYEVKTLTREMTHYEEGLMKIDSERLNMLKNCKIEDIDLPLEDGFLDAISLDDANISEAAYQVHIDYGLLEAKYQEKYAARLEAEISAKLETIDNDLHALTPNAKALERLQEVDQRLKEFDREFSKAKHEVNRVTSKFNEVRDKRKELFMDAYNHISGNIDKVYKALTKSPASPLGGSADLTLEDDEVPFAAGVKYHAMPPLKRFRDMELLSGGEKTMAALALLFAIHSFQPSPFFVLDEIDAALDNSNVKKIARYIKESAGPGFQFIVISLKSTMFENSDALVGIYRDQRENCSKTIGLDLRQYPEEHETIALPEGHQIAAAEN